MTTRLTGSSAIRFALWRIQESIEEANDAASDIGVFIAGEPGPELIAARQAMVSAIDAGTVALVKLADVLGYDVDPIDRVTEKPRRIPNGHPLSDAERHSQEREGSIEATEPR